MNLNIKRTLYILRILVASMICFLVFCFFCSCDASKGNIDINTAERAEKRKSVLILSSDCGVGKTISEYTGAILSERGYEIYFDRDGKNEFDGVIAVGKEGVCEVLESGDADPLVYCVWEDFEKTDELCGAVGIRACISSKDLAKVSLALLPNAGRFAVMSDTKGAIDVQDACDEFDRCNVDYRVEALSEGQPYGDAIIGAAKKGYSAVILPYFELSAGGIDIKSHSAETAIIAVGEGEPVKGALATFCVDAQALSLDTADLFETILSGVKSEGIEDGYYKVCISESVEKYFETDREEVGNLFPVTVTE